MGLSEAIAAAQNANQETPQAIHDWLSAPTGTMVDSGRTLTLSDIAVMFEPIRAGQILATIKAAAASDTTSDLIVTVLTTGGVIATGNAGVQDVISGLVTAGVLQPSEEAALLAVGQRAQIRANQYGLASAPTTHEIHMAIGV
jgi:hypothetical protein